MRSQFPILAIALLVSPAVRAADAPAAAVQKAPPRVFAADLSHARLEPNTVYLAVSAERMPATPSTPPLQKDDTPISIAAGYGLMTDTFQNVVAIAPRTTVALNTNLGTPNPYVGMQPSDVLKVLLASLTEAQWKLLTGDGIGLSDLSTDAQRDEFQALFPAPKLHAQVQPSATAATPIMTDVVITQDELRRSRLRLGQFIQMGVPVVGKHNSEWLDTSATFGNSSFMLNPFPEDQQSVTVAGATVRSVVPNAVKASDLDLDVAALRKSVPLAGLKTVDDLMAAIEKVSGHELYADRRYGGRSITLLGAPSARARDLLSALALCVSGTYRKVGPAYVLTDDIQGSGARKALIQRFAATAQMLGHGMVQEAGDRVIEAHPVETLPSLDERTALTDEQQAEMIKKASEMPMGSADIQVPFAKLTSAQRAFVSGFAATQNAAPGDMKVTTDGNILMMRQSALLLVVPSLPDPISLEYYIGAGRLYQPSNKLQQAKWSAMAAKMNAAPTPAPEKRTDKAAPKSHELGAAFARYPLRAVYSQARTAAEVESVIGAMKTAGLNALYLDIFSEGSAHIPAEGLHGDSHGEPDILTAATAGTAGSGIAVFPVLNLLRWSDAPEACRDLTILGETSAQAEAWQSTYERVVFSDQTIEEARQSLPPPVYSVNPLAPEVKSGLGSLVRRVAHTPGVSGVVFRETATSGYERQASGSFFYSNGPEVGYTPANRLAFLRQEHVDPIDLDPSLSVGNAQADLSLPQFDNDEALGDASGHWNTFRYNEDIAFLRKLFDTATSGGTGHPQVWIQQRRRNFGQFDWYGIWADPQSSPPEIPDEIVTDYDPDRDYAALAHAQSPLAINIVPLWVDQTSAGLADRIAAIKPGWDGFLLMPNGTERAGNPLAGIAKSLGAAKP